ncbi:MAG TPA: serine/threonine-protein kinase [Fimbriiglobus sp.]|nr:serine/threonine-protein kinase [Fimbriiglobus sp.]
MSPAATHEPPYSKTAGEEALPGYRLIEPLGRGGFGEVWKCMAPGELPKAVKFVAGDNGDARLDDASLRQEFEAFQQIKMIRHPYLLTLERVELVRGELVMVMELADRQLLDRFDECRTEGLPGIPREELLCYLAEAAEALDVIAAEHKLQHLDVKPANLFIISNHAKVGDYGLVARLEKGDASAGRNTTRGLTPRYAAPEVANGNVDYRSDQYSLALVYQEMLTGVFPFKAKSAPQMLLAHATVPPDLAALPEGDRGPVGRALAKDPGGRFQSCLELIAALIGGRKSGQVSASGPIRRAPSRLSGTVAASPDHPTTAGTTTMPAPARPPQPAPGRPALTVPGRPAGPPRPPARNPDPPPRRAPGEDTDDGAVEWVTPTRKPRSSVMRSELLDDNVPDVEPVGQLSKFWSVMAAVELNGQTPGAAGKLPDTPSASAVIEALLRSAGGETGVARRPDGSWVVRVPLRPMIGVVRLKLRVAAERWAQEMIELDETTVAVRAYAPPSGFFGGGRKKSGIELVVHIPSGEGLGEAEVTGRLFGNPDVKFARAAAEDLPRRLDEVRQHLQNVTDRRKHPRLPVDFPAVLIPVTGDGAIYPAVPGRCRDVSREGIRLLTEASVVTTHAYVGVGVPGADGWCVLTRLVRSRELATGYEYGGKFRTDIK